MRLCVLAAASALLTVSCSEPVADASSCLKQVDENFDKCIEQKAPNCTVKRLREHEMCDREAGHPRTAAH